MAFSLSKNLQNGLTPFLWDDLRAPSTSLRSGATAPDLISWFASGNIRGYGFNGTNTTEMLDGILQFSHGHVIGSDISPHIHWMPTTADAGSVKWQLEYTWVAN